MTEYGDSYFVRLSGDSLRAAGVIVPLVLDLVRPQSVIDVGCGTGEWLSVCRQHGIVDLLGIDGDWVPRDRLKIPREQFKVADLRRSFGAGRTFDLAMCVEVAEHLPPGAADALIATLTK